MANEATILIARDIRHQSASSALTERQAKLYSQRLRRDMGRAGLTGFSSSDIDFHLNEAMLLIQCSWLERNDDLKSPWRDSMKRAAEILEWLSQSSLKPPGAPLHLLAAAAYQLADYPALALGHLRHVPNDQPFSLLLREFLRANFPVTLKIINNYWQDYYSHHVDERIDSADLTTRTYQHVVMSVGTICAYLKTGDSKKVERALTKLEQLADSLLYSRDSYSYLLALLTAASSRRFVETCLWPHIGRFQENANDPVGRALIRFAKSAFVSRRLLIWPAQADGINRLRQNSSFVLCTPTGSGKTTVATLAIVQALFPAQIGNSTSGTTDPGNIVLYLVPSRALAAEVEKRLSQDLRNIAAGRVVVTGLYGGIDWGPTDVWLQNDRPTIVICTFEKADALLRFLGVVFLHRVRLVIIDEVHMVEQDPMRVGGLQDGTSRAFRLEQLGSRLFRARTEYHFRVIALSAVAARASSALGRWIGDTIDVSPTTSSYRSTRQMLGHLEVAGSGHCTIRYALMDGHSLKFVERGQAEAPYVYSPFPPLPTAINMDDGPEVRMRAPTLWAALHLAAERPDGSKPAVLISLTQNVETFADTCADLINNWPQNSLPRYQAIDQSDPLWSRCLASVEDYFSSASLEYRLLQRGIAVHHGKMPGLVARRLKNIIDNGYVRVIIATSTLSEGVNIPVNYLLIPSIFRGTSRMSLQEFTNLIGRAGRPGIATEGNALVVLPEKVVRRDRSGRMREVPNRQWNGYNELVAEIEATTSAAAVGIPEDNASSALAHLLSALETAWSELTGSSNRDEFLIWLEQTSVITSEDQTSPAHNYLDTLDSFLIATILEIEELQQAELTPDLLEDELTALWRRTYAFAATQGESMLQQIWLMRGKAIKSKYPDAIQRRYIYKTSLTPRSATSLLQIREAVGIKLQEGNAYARMSDTERLVFIRDVLELISRVPAFKFSTTLGRRQNYQDWPIQLQWWLAKRSLPSQPRPKDIPTWYDFVSQNFIYRGAWGLGSIIGLLLESTGTGALNMVDWPGSGLPWIAFWIKELITWGTLDPVAAFLLARGDAIDRISAETDARAYYGNFPTDADPNDILDPSKIRDWVELRHVRSDTYSPVQEFEVEAMLKRQAADYLDELLLVTPIDLGTELIWIDSAGYNVASSIKPDNWPTATVSFDFYLDITRSVIVGKRYL